MTKFDVGNIVKRSEIYLEESFPHLDKFYRKFITPLTGKVMAVEGRMIHVQWGGREWEKAGPVKYFDWQLENSFSAEISFAMKLAA